MASRSLLRHDGLENIARPARHAIDADQLRKPAIVYGAGMEID
jgi:hypothetical protein